MTRDEARDHLLIAMADTLAELAKTVRLHTALPRGLVNEIRDAQEDLREAGEPSVKRRRRKRVK